MSRDIQSDNIVSSRPVGNAEFNSIHQIETEITVLFKELA